MRPNSSVETFIARTACDARKMLKTCAEVLSGPLSHLPPKLCEACAGTTLAHFFAQKKGANAKLLHNFSEPPGTQAESVPRIISTQFSQPGVILKLEGKELGP